MITCKHLFEDKTFENTGELFKELRENAARIIAVKKSSVYKSFEKGCRNSWLTDKGIAEKVGPQMKADYIYPVINTTNYLDQHYDCHFPGIWTKSAKEQQGKLYYVCDHEVKTSTIIAWPSDVNVMVKTVPWSFVGKDYEGNTEALIYEIPKAKIANAFAKDIIDNRRPVQNSVRMQYVNIKMAMNSTDKEDIKYKEYWDARIDMIANKEHAMELGFFFGVEEAKIVLEGSMVINGSNDATPIRQKELETESTSGKSGMDMGGASDDNKNIEFINKMIPHHEAALKMVADYKKKVDNSDLKTIMENIATSQKDEIAKMKAIKKEESKSLNAGQPSKFDTDLQPLKDTVQEQPQEYSFLDYIQNTKFLNT